MGAGQTPGGRGPGLGIVQGLEPGESRPAQPTLHPQRPGSRQVRTAVDTVASSRRCQVTEGRWATEPTGHRGVGILGATLARPLSWEAGRTFRGALAGPPQGPQDWPRRSGAALWQVSSPGKDRVPPRQGLAGRACPNRGGGAKDTLQAQSYFHPYRPSVTRPPEKDTHVTRRPCGRPQACPPHTGHPPQEDRGLRAGGRQGPEQPSPAGQTRATPSSEFLGELRFSPRA